MQLVGRDRECKRLQIILDSPIAELVAVYGRRRIGKTFLIRTFFERSQCVFFQASGIHNAKLATQLKEFSKSMQFTFYASNKGPLATVPRNWMDAFGMLTDAIELELKKHRKKIVIFLDEFPWMATHKSGLLEAFDYHWNRFWVNYPRLKVIICGSAASWIIDKILNNKGGLHNRVTQRINLSPFSLYETKLFLHAKGIKWNNAQILSLYMAIGGIPYYLKFIEKGLSATQNIDQLCFQQGGILRDEFRNLFASLFDNADMHVYIIQILASSHQGVARAEIEHKINIRGGRLSVKLSELVESGFISESLSSGRERGISYRLTDEYSLFYLKWIQPIIKMKVDVGYWDSKSISAEGKVWAGYAFESVCYKHLSNIRHVLHIPNGSIVTSFQYRGKRIKALAELEASATGAQIDLLFDRPDNVVSICEIKYCTEPYVIDKIYAKNLLQKVEIYLKSIKSNKNPLIAMITACELKPNLYSEDLVSGEVKLDDLFVDLSI